MPETISKPAQARGSTTPDPWRGVLAALCTCILGLGLARFSYTPLIPALIGAHWFTPSEAVFLGAANMAGYLAGALSARLVMRRLGLRTTLRLLMVFATASLFACSQPVDFAWFCAWRLVSGFTGAGLIVLSAPSVLPFVPQARRGLAGGVIFTGVGVGIAGSGSLLPLLLAHGPAEAWLALSVAGVAMTVIAWNGWPKAPPRSNLPAQVSSTPSGTPLRLLFAAYATSAIGQVPAMLFLSDFVARGLGHGVAAGSHAWAVFGIGALAGPLSAGALADRIGFTAGLRVNWIAQILACLAMWWAPSAAVVVAAGLVVGAGIPVLVVLVLGRSQELARDAAPQAWSIATTCFAGGQVIGAYGLSWVFKQTADYRLLFGSAVLAMVFAFCFGEASRWTSRQSGAMLQGRRARLAS